MIVGAKNYPPPPLPNFPKRNLPWPSQLVEDCSPSPHFSLVLCILGPARRARRSVKEHGREKEGAPGAAAPMQTD